MCEEAKHAKTSIKHVTNGQSFLLELIHSNLVDFKNTIRRGKKKNITSPL